MIVFADEFLVSEVVNPLLAEKPAIAVAVGITKLVAQAAPTNTHATAHPCSVPSTNSFFQASGSPLGLKMLS